MQTDGHFSLGSPLSHPAPFGTKNASLRGQPKVNSHRYTAHLASTAEIELHRTWGDM